MQNTPKQDGYHFPAEWHPHVATWLSWPHKEASWPGKIESIYQPYCAFIKTLVQKEKVCINVLDEQMIEFASKHLNKESVDMSKIQFFLNPTNDAWCRDHGPAFLINTEKKTKAIVDWGYNAWGGKYPPFEEDDIVPTKIAQFLNLPVYHPGIIMEGGSVDFNGEGTILTTTSCLLNPNRNPHLSKEEIETYLSDYYGIEQILWLGDGIEGDDTDGHIDDITRFVNETTVVTVVEYKKNDSNYEPLKKNLTRLQKMRLLGQRQLDIVAIPMPSKPIIYDGQRLPASYANFYISNAAVIVPTYKDKNDDIALQILSDCFQDRQVVGIDSSDIIWGLGSWHCLSQQDPDVYG